MSIANNGGRVFMVSTTTQVADSEANDQVKNGRQAVIGGQLAKVSRGAFEPIQDFTRLTSTLAEWGKQNGLRLVSDGGLSLPHFDFQGTSEP